MFTVTVKFLPGGYKTVTCQGPTKLSEIIKNAGGDSSKKWTVRDDSANELSLNTTISSGCTLRATPADGMKGN